MMTRRNFPAIAKTASPAKPRRLDLRQQRIVSDVIAHAQKEPGLHVIKAARNGWTYTASRSPIGTIRWRVVDGGGKPVASGECS